MSARYFNAGPQDEIKLKNEIGKGSYGEVLRAEWHGQEVAAKRLHPEFFKEEYGQTTIDHYIGEFRKEWEVLRKLNHPNIVKMHTVLFPPNESPIIVMELLHCDLYYYIETYARSAKVSPSQWMFIAVGIVKGLVYLHGQKPPVVHRDIATKNILLTVDGQPKIGDLGVAKVFAAGKEVFATAGRGTPVYAAPETYLDTVNYRAKYGVKADVFSFGVTLLAIVIGHEPVVFPKKVKTDGSMISEIERRKTDISQIKGHRLEEVILHCLQDDSSERPHAHEILKKLKLVKQSTVKTKIGQLAKCNPNTEFQKISQPPSYDYVFKVIILGSSGVGKTCLVKLLKDPTSNIEGQRSTIGIEFQTHWYKYNSQYLQITITDTAGQEKFQSITPNYIRRSDGVFLVFDVSDRDSFDMLPYWLEMIEWYAPENCKKLLVGNKVDLRKSTSGKSLDSSEQSLVIRESALIFASNFGIPYIETSAKEDTNSVYNMLQYMVEMLMSTVSVTVEDINVEERQRQSSGSSFPPEQEKQKVCPLRCNWI